MLFSQITLVVATAALLPACMSLRQENCRSEEQSAIHDSLYFGTAKPDGVVTGEEMGSIPWRCHHSSVSAGAHRVSSVGAVEYGKWYDGSRGNLRGGENYSSQRGTLRKECSRARALRTRNNFNESRSCSDRPFVRVVLIAQLPRTEQNLDQRDENGSRGGLEGSRLSSDPQSVGSWESGSFTFVQDEFSIRIKKHKCKTA